MSLRSQAMSGFRWTASIRLLSQVITWAITLVVIRLLTPADYGLLAMATVFVAVLAMFSEMGLGAAVVQKADVDVPLLRRVFAVVLSIHFFLAAVLAIAAPLIAEFYSEPRVTMVIQALSFQFVLAGFAVIPDARLQRRMEFRNRSLLDLSAAIAASVSTVVLALGGAGVWSLVAGSLVGQAWRTIGLNWLSPFLYWPDPSLKGLRTLLTFGGQVAGSQLFWMFYSQIDILMCAKWLGKEALGFYSVAMHLASLPNQRISGLVNQVAFPAFSSMQHEIHKVGANMLMGVRVLSFFAFPVSWGLSSVAPEVVSVVLGGMWASASFPLQALALIMPLRMVGNFVQVAIQGVGRSDLIVRNAMIAASLAPMAFALGIYWGGLMGLSVAWLFLSPIVFLQGAARSLPVLGLRLKDLLLAIVPAAGASFTMYAAVLAVARLPALAEQGLLRLCVLVLVGVLTYVFVSLVLNRKATQEVLAVVRGIATVKSG